ncbi:glycoside hydrolase family 68 protein [Oerskovia sp. M15]
MDARGRPPAPRLLRPAAPGGANSMPTEYTMPDIPQDFPVMTDQNGQQVWVWDTWTLTDAAANQISFKGWEVIFSLVADPNAGYTFDDRHTHARMGFFYRKADIPTEDRPENGGWIYGGHVFPDGAAGSIFEDQSFSTVTEWSGSTRIMDGNKLRIFYTAVAFYRDANEQELKPPTRGSSRPRLGSSPTRTACGSPERVISTSS